MSDDRPIRSRDLELFRTIRNALTAAAHDRGQDWPEADQRMIARFFLEYIEAKKLRIVPIQPDRLMQDAINHALDKGKRMTIAWVGKRHKNTWRYRAALDAAPCWKNGYDADLIEGKTAKSPEQQAADHSSET